MLNLIENHPIYLLMVIFVTAFSFVEIVLRVSGRDGFSQYGGIIPEWVTYLLLGTVIGGLVFPVLLAFVPQETRAAFPYNTHQSVVLFGMASGGAWG